jgi:O-succinylbenzoic acid--CoA ligase
MKAHPSAKIFIDNQEVDLINPIVVKEQSEWSKSILKFISEFLDAHKEVSVKTSGSTGTPKWMKISKSKMQASAQMTGAFLDLQPANTALLCLSADYIAGKMMIARALTLGLHLTCAEPKSEIELNQRFDFCAMIPMQAMANMGSLHLIKNLIIGGGAIPNNGLKQLLELNHSGIYQTFGMTETLSHVALKKLNESSYLAPPGVTFSISERGTLEITASKLIDEKLITNDLIILESESSFKWLGRADNIINSGGVKLIPEKIEAILSSHIQNPFFVAGVPDEKLGEKLILVEESSKPTVLVFDNINGLNSFEKPKQIYVLKEYARTETNKIQRTKTLELLIKTLR